MTWTDLAILLLVLVAMAIVCWTRYQLTVWMTGPIMPSASLCTCADLPSPSSRGWSTMNGASVWRCPQCGGGLRDDQLQAAARSLWW